MRGLHTFIDIASFTIKRKNLDISYNTIKHMVRTSALKNHLNIVGECSKLFKDERISPDGFTMAFLLDESHISLHAYTAPTIAKIAIDIFTCSGDPLNHTNCVNDITSYIINNYDSTLVSRITVPRF
jgi:S-adenosylmethionine/arginine decarboxylase-like enzyme